MNENLVIELQDTIKKLKMEIIEKQQKLNILIEQYQELTGIELDNIEDNIEN